MTLDEQINELTNSVSPDLLALVRPGIVLVVAGVVITGSLTGNPAFYATGLFLALLALAIRQVTPHIRNAIKGLREGIRQSGSVDITIRQWQDAENNSHEDYSGRIMLDRQPLWQMDFATPQHWQPEKGQYPAQLVFIRGVEWPVLILTENGLLYPASRPKHPQTHSQ